MKLGDVVGKIGTDSDIFLTYLSPHISDFLWSAAEYVEDIIPAKQPNVDVHVNR